jgi:hypothetical protein
VLAGAICSLQVQALAFHVHAVPEHAADNRHTHAPAIHDHTDNFDLVAHVESLDASTGTVITIAVPVVIAVSALAVDAELTGDLRAPELQLVGDARAIEVRSHGPPPIRYSLLRGPPSSHFL